MITISEDGRCIAKALATSDALNLLAQEIDTLEKDEEMDIHIWREE